MKFILIRGKQYIQLIQEKKKWLTSSQIRGIRFKICPNTLFHVENLLKVRKSCNGNLFRKIHSFLNFHCTNCAILVDVFNFVSENLYSDLICLKLRRNYCCSSILSDPQSQRPMSIIDEPGRAVVLEPSPIDEPRRVVVLEPPLIDEPGRVVVLEPPPISIIDEQGNAQGQELVQEEEQEEGIHDTIAERATAPRKPPPPNPKTG